jgi:hypothetical protein
MPADGFVQVGSAGHRGAADAIGPAALTLKRTDGSVTHQDSAFSEAEAAQDALAGLATLLRGWGFAERNRDGLLWLDSWSLARRQPQIRSAVDDVMKRGHVRLVALIVHTSIGVNEGLVDVTRAVTASAEQDLGLAPGALALPDSAP